MVPVMVVERDDAGTAASVVEPQPAPAAAAAAAAAAPPPPPGADGAVAATSAAEEYLDTITNEQARGWWKTYIGQRVATYNFLQDATMAWMLKVNPAMTQAEASIIAATVCFGIDRDGDGEITFAEFGKFSQELGNEYTVEKLREYEVPRKDSQDVDEEKLAEYAEYLGISPETEKNLLWIARRCMHAPLPKGWNEYTNEQGQPYFHHEAKQETTWDHPLDSHVGATSCCSSTHRFCVTDWIEHVFVACVRWRLRAVQTACKRHTQTIGYLGHER
jgi:hypothetical protein